MWDYQWGFYLSHALVHDETSNGILLATTGVSWLHCVSVFFIGWVFWDDENIEELDGGNMVRGFTPEGVYELDTLIYFCCNTKGNKSIPIELPLQNSFYLLAYNSEECQSVQGATVTSEYIQWDDEDRGNKNAHSDIAPYGVNLDAWNTNIHYCYYDTGKHISFEKVRFSSLISTCNQGHPYSNHYPHFCFCFLAWYLFADFTLPVW